MSVEAMAEEPILCKTAKGFEYRRRGAVERQLQVIIDEFSSKAGISSPQGILLPAGDRIGAEANLDEGTAVVKFHLATLSELSREQIRQLICHEVSHHVLEHSQRALRIRRMISPLLWLATILSFLLLQIFVFEWLSLLVALSVYVFGLYCFL